MDEIDALGRQMLMERPLLTRGRLAVFRESVSADEWFPQLKVTLKKSGTDEILWNWASHDLPIDEEEAPPYGEDGLLEKYFELERPVKSPRGLEAVFLLGAGLTNSGRLSQFSASLYLYPSSVEERGVQVGVLDFTGGLSSQGVPLFMRVNFPW
ncbi:MAG: hypothetical protein K2W82_03335 [Candidatus Obscuribacterales bacterium]|nr:hypothetical protein [Candidatus Obscuribacterales bacterium]